MLCEALYQFRIQNYTKRYSSSERQHRQVGTYKKKNKKYRPTTTNRYIFFHAIQAVMLSKLYVYALCFFFSLTACYILRKTISHFNRRARGRLNMQHCEKIVFPACAERTQEYLQSGRFLLAQQHRLRGNQSTI